MARRIRVFGEMRVVFLILLLTVGSAGRSGLVGRNNRILRQNFQSIAEAQTNLFLTTVDLIFLQVNELVANMTERLTMFENRLVEVERRLGRVEAEIIGDDDHHIVTETPTEEPTGYDVIISLLRGMNHLLVEKTDSIDQRLENLEVEVSNFQWRPPHGTDTGYDKTVPLTTESPQTSDASTKGALDRTSIAPPTLSASTLTPTRTDGSAVYTPETLTTKETSTENLFRHIFPKIYFQLSATSSITSPSSAVPTTHPLPFTTNLTSASAVTTNSTTQIITSTAQPQVTTSELTTQVKSTTVKSTTEPPTTTKAIPRTCAEVWKNKMEEPGDYLIDPDGDGGVEPFQADCDEGFTTIRHKKAYWEIRVTNHEEPGSFVFRPKYPVSVEQLKALTATSKFCDQYIKYECRSAVLLFGPKDEGSMNYGWLVSIDGEKLINWGGAPTNSSLCACGVDDSCVTPGLPCNCDGDTRIKLVDEGVLMDKDVLPITEVHLGDTGGRRENGRLWLGSLRCFD